MNQLFTGILNEALRLEGSAQALARRLRVPGSTLARWLAGRAQTPLGAFLVTLEYIMQQERAADAQDPAAQPAHAAQDTVPLPLVDLAARCGRCGGSAFRANERGKLRLTSVLSCAQCGADAIHGHLLAQVAKEAIQRPRQPENQR